MVPPKGKRSKRFGSDFFSGVRYLVGRTSAKEGTALGVKNGALGGGRHGTRSTRTTTTRRYLRVFRGGWGVGGAWVASGVEFRRFSYRLFGVWLGGGQAAFSVLTSAGGRSHPLVAASAAIGNGLHLRCWLPGLGGPGLGNRLDSALRATRLRGQSPSQWRALSPDQSCYTYSETLDETWPSL